MWKRIIFGLGVTVVLVLLIVLAVRGHYTEQVVRLSDGRVFHIEAVTYGTQHVVGWNDWWNVPLRKILPNSAIQFLTPAKGQSRQTTATPALIIWVYARDAATSRYVDCQGVRAALVDESGDVYPANGLAHGAFSKGFNRQAYTFEVFPRSAATLKLQLEPRRSREPSTILIPNPGRAASSNSLKPEALPVTRKVENLDFTLESLTIQTNGGPGREWEALSLHWAPVFSLKEGFKPATNWESPEWVAEDSLGNRGQTLGLHQPVLKFIGTVYPKPEAVTDETRIWRLPVARLPTTTNGIQWNTNIVVRGRSITVFGLFPPGSYTFSEGQLTNLPSGSMSGNGWTGLSQQVFPGKWKSWATHGSTHYTVFLRSSGGKADQRVAVGLRRKQTQGAQTVWTESKSSGDNVRAYVFEEPIDDAQEVELEVILLEPVHAEFVVHPDLERLSAR